MKTNILQKSSIILACIIGAFTARSAGQSADGGKAHTVILCSDGKVFTFGKNLSGQLGNNSTTDSSTPVEVTGISGVVSVGAGEEHTLAVKNDGTLWAWGANIDGELGDGSTISKSTPVQVPGLTGIISAAGGDGWSLALKNDGTVWAWGNNSGGQLGNGSTTPSLSPAQVTGMSSIISIRAAEKTSYALKNDGTVWAWGDNGNGEIGDGTTDDKETPVQVSGLTGIIQIASWEEHALALKDDGTVWAWGANYYGGIGDGTVGNIRTTPVQVSGLTGIIRIACGEDFSLALKNDGSFWGWGSNQFGQFGNGSTTASALTPVQSSGVTNVNYMSTGEDHTILIKNDGSIATCGRGSNGQLGNGSTSSASIPQAVSSCPVPLSIEERNASATDFEIYPNPSDGKLSIRINGEVSLISITDMLGQKVAELRPNGEVMAPDLSSAPAGIYLIRAVSGTKQRIKKVSITK
jgi:alpha-tubulin suppressor-like RCC1 family protein